jgi:hypothetical protein
MDRWNNNKESFDYIGRFGNSYEYFDLPTKLRTKAMAEAFGAVFNDGDAVVVCGSSGEIANDPNLSYLEFSDRKYFTVHSYYILFYCTKYYFFFVYISRYS